MGAPKSFEKLTSITAVTKLSETVYQPKGWYPESLTNGALTSGTGWTATDDFVVSTGVAVYIRTATGAGTLTQAVGTLARTGRGGAKYDFTYTVSDPTGTAPAINITTGFAAETTALTNLGTTGTYTVRFTAAATPGAFVLDGVLTAAGQTKLDSLSLLEVVDVIIGNRQAVRAVLEVATAAINFTTDGTTPTITTGTYQGHILNPGDILTLNDVTEIRQFRCINAVASNGAVVKVTYSLI
ncbi:MAG TPA: chitobiase/beta-hexosaminidase C-terminal domain-containing protein [Candidatus Wunengus sp. YC61]|uniref:chitobiase/beta-hexosaminidase C-terminal domain-containing protein n=1 Tax=Candidatus Wunengus sp. YC61 TaxID=3367698 RepID=UPI0040289221